MTKSESQTDEEERAEFTGMDVNEYEEQWSNGKSFVQIAKERGVSQEKSSVILNN